ncbi:MAG: RNA 2',3'-cyclic phosphodiesterase [Eubacterium sp.]|nr:RNA 2',3'-cyclic phosphodiesterase [Eubacterium sp.]
MRLFIAIQFSSEMQKELLDTLHRLKQAGVRGNYTPAANLHMTLAFIGETRQVDEIKEVLNGVKYAPFRLALTDLGTFGDLLWVGAKGNQGMKKLVRDLRSGLDAAGISYDKKEFKPHITLIRKMAGSLPRGFTVGKTDMMVKKISLMKSENKNGRMVYTEIYSV